MVLTRFETHEVTNQVPPLQAYNAFESDTVLSEALHREGAGWARAEVSLFGAEVGKVETLEWGRQANRFPPELVSYDRLGNRIDRVDYHPSYHRLMELAINAEVHALPWNRPGPGAHVARVAKHFLLNQAESGVTCPITMTFAVVPALRRAQLQEWLVRVTSKQYDHRFLPAPQKRGCTMGMAMTEKQGGSDVRSNRTQATAIQGAAGLYRLNGHKWFCSAPMSDAFLTLAQSEDGLTCYLVPRFLPDGTKNRITIQRLKDKLGNRSNASAEIEYQDTWALAVGAPGRGVPTIIEMVNHTRLDCISGTAGMMRTAVAQAIHHASYRTAFGKKLIEQPLMSNVLADLALESEAATCLLMRLARAYDEGSDPTVRLFSRITTAMGKYWVCKRGPALAFEAMECLGGAGYVEEHILPRIYREMPVSSIWEGSGNVICLDVLRAMAREPLALEAFLVEAGRAQGANRFLDAALAKLSLNLRNPINLEQRARALVEHMVLVFQGALLVENAPSFISDCFCASRLGGQRGTEYGTLSSGASFEKIIDRARPN